MLISSCCFLLRGIDNVVGVNLCLRNNDCVAFVMPYIPHDKFHQYVDKFNPKELQTYMRNLLIALKRVHSFGIIHRDVKPGNFLHDRKNQRYLLVDFGLAQTVGSTSSSSATMNENSSSSLTTTTAGSEVNNTPLATSKKRKNSVNEETENSANVLNAVKRARLYQQQPTAVITTSQPQQQQQQPRQAQNENVIQTQQQQPMPPSSQLESIPSPFKSPLKQINEITTPKNSLRVDAPLTRHIKSAVLSYSIEAQRQRLINTTRAGTSNRTPTELNDSPTTLSSKQYNTDNRKNSSDAGGVQTCYCYGRPTVCNVCIVKKEVRASRAGTPGYRPPEVLLKYPNQTTAVDIWAIGVIMISILSSCYPFFMGSDDFTALAEMITIFGDDIIKETAMSLSRHICISRKKKPLHLRKLCVRLRNRKTINEANNKLASTGNGKSGVIQEKLMESCSNCQQIPIECLCINSTNLDFSNDIYPESAYDLMTKLLAINPQNRITAEEALNHPFFMDTFV